MTRVTWLLLAATALGGWTRRWASTQRSCTALTPPPPTHTHTPSSLPACPHKTRAGQLQAPRRPRYLQKLVSHVLALLRGLQVAQASRYRICWCVRRRSGVAAGQGQGAWYQSAAAAARTAGQAGVHGAQGHRGFGCTVGPAHRASFPCWRAPCPPGLPAAGAWCCWDGCRPPPGRRAAGRPRPPAAAAAAPLRAAAAAALATKHPGRRWRPYGGARRARCARGVPHPHPRAGALGRLAAAAHARARRPRCAWAHRSPSTPPHTLSIVFGLHVSAPSVAEPRPRERAAPRARQRGDREPITTDTMS